MAESEIVKAIRRQRAEVARNELDTLRRLARLWAPSYRYLKQQADALAKLIQERRDAGEPVELEYIYSHQRYKAMAEQARKMIREYSRAAAGQISGAEAEVYEIGKQNGQQLISIAEPDDPMWTRVNRRETRIMDGMTANGSPLYDLLNKSYSETMDAITKSLTIGISTGQGSSWIAQQLTDAGLIPEQRALLIARTEVNRAYRQSNWEQMQSSRAIKGYRRMCYPPTACFACLELDGEFYPVGTEPCDHPNGKCSFVPVTKHFDPINDPSWERGPEWFARQDEETQRKLMGAGRFDLWKQQGVDPRDMVWIKPNDVWGGSPAVRPLHDLPNSFAFRPYPKSDLIPFTRTEPEQKVVDDFNMLSRRLYRDFKITTDEDVKYLDFDNFNEAISGFTEVIREQPELRNFVSRIEVSEKIGHQSVLQVNGKNLLTVNPLYFGSTTKENLVKLIEQSIKDGDAIRNFTVKSAGYHEAGHLLVDLYHMRHPETKQPATQIINRAMSALKGKRNRAEEIIKISNRAIINNNETIAEAISDYYTNGRNAAPLSKAIYKVVTGD